MAAVFLFLPVFRYEAMYVQLFIDCGFRFTDEQYIKVGLFEQYIYSFVLGSERSARTSQKHLQGLKEDLV